MTQHSDAATKECWVCGGPCREPFHLPPVPLSYPFMNMEAKMATHPTPEPTPARERRGRRLHEHRAHTPSEDRTQ